MLPIGSPEECGLHRIRLANPANPTLIRPNPVRIGRTTSRTGATSPWLLARFTAGLSFLPGLVRLTLLWASKGPRGRPLVVEFSSIRRVPHSVGHLW